MTLILFSSCQFSPSLSYSSSPVAVAMEAHFKDHDLVALMLRLCFCENTGVRLDFWVTSNQMEEML